MLLAKVQGFFYLFLELERSTCLRAPFPLFYMGYLHNLIFQTGKIWEISMAFPPGEGEPLSIPWTGFWYIELGAQIISILVILYLKFRKIGELPEDHFITLLTQNSSLETLDAQLIKNLVLKKDKQVSTKKDEVL